METALNFKDYTTFITKMIGALVHEERTKKNISMRKFADNIGISPTVLSDLENGTKIPRMETILKVLHALNISFEKVFSESILPHKRKVKEDNIVDIQKCLIAESLSNKAVGNVLNYIDFLKSSDNIW